MNSRFFILLVVLFLPTLNLADNFVDDVYFQRKKAVKDQIASKKPLTPSYNKKVKEIIFLEDTTNIQYPDTVKAIIRY